MMALRDQVNYLWVNAERLASFAQRAAGAIRRNGGSNRSPVATVFFVDVLDYLFAPLMLEIDIDIEPWS